jgi:hypothetical protein
VGPQRLGSLDVLFGLPTGLRVQGALFREDNWSFLIEGFAGVYVIFPMAGGGARFSYTFRRVAQDAFVLRPGLDAYQVVNVFGRGSILFIGADVECVWVHDCGACSLELGLDFGAMADRVGALPQVGVLGGIRF